MRETICLFVPSAFLWGPIHSLINPYIRLAPQPLWLLEARVSTETTVPMDTILTLSLVGEFAVMVAGSVRAA